MSLSVSLDGATANLMRGNVLVGVLKLDSDLQIAEVAIESAASREEAERIIRLAASHVAQFVVARSIVHSGVLIQRLPRLPGCTPSRSRELLDFDAIAPEHAGLSVDDLASVMEQVGVRILRR